MRRSRRVRATALLGLLVGLLTTIPLVVPAGAAFVSGGKAPSDQPTYSYDAPSVATTPGRDTRISALITRPGPRTLSPSSTSTSLQSSRRATKGAETALPQAGKRRLAKRLGEIPRFASPVGQGGSAGTGRWWEYDVSGQRKIVVEHPDGTVHVGIPKPQSTHTAGGPPKYNDHGNFGHVGQ